MENVISALQLQSLNRKICNTNSDSIKQLDCSSNTHLTLV